MSKIVFKSVSFRQHRITGWAFLEDDPLRRLTIDLVIDGRVVGSTTADVIRRDLKKTLHPDRLVGYHTALPLEFWTGDAYDLTLVAREVGSVIGHQRLKTTSHLLPGTITLQGELLDGGPREVTGWVTDGTNPISVVVEIDNRAIRQVVAQDESQLVGLMPVGFKVDIPASFFSTYFIASSDFSPEGLIFRYRAK